MAARQTPAQKAAAAAEEIEVDTSDSPDTPIGAEQPEKMQGLKPSVVILDEASDFQAPEAALLEEYRQALLTIHETLGFDSSETLETLADGDFLDVMVRDCGQVMRAQYEAALDAIPGTDVIDDGDVAWMPVNAFKVIPTENRAWVYFDAMPHEGRTDIDTFNLWVPLATLRSRSVA